MENMVFTENQRRWLRLMVRGFGFSAAKKEFTAKERREMEELIKAGLVNHGKNHSGDTVGMYHIYPEDHDRVKQIIQSNT